MDICAYIAYPVRFIPSEEGGYTVVVSGVDGAISEGATRKKAEQAVIDVIADMANYYLDEKKQIPPAPLQREGEELVRIPIVMALKIVLRNEMLALGISQRELAKRLGISTQLLNQTLDLARTRTSIDSLDACFQAIGKKLSIAIN